MLNWSTMESIKNALIFCPKYEVVSKCYAEQPHVVFANQAPDRSKLSADRFYLVDLDIDPSISTGINIPLVTASRDVRLKKVKWVPGAGLSFGSGNILPSDVVDLTRDARLDGIGIGPLVTADGNVMKFNDKPISVRQHANLFLPPSKKARVVEPGDSDSSDDKSCILFSNVLNATLYVHIYYIYVYVIITYYVYNM
jgi:hypothetical protein